MILCWLSKLYLNACLSNWVSKMTAPDEVWREAISKRFTNTHTKKENLRINAPISFAVIRVENVSNLGDGIGHYYVIGIWIHARGAVRFISLSFRVFSSLSMCWEFIFVVEIQQTFGIPTISPKHPSKGYKTITTPCRKLPNTAVATISEWRKTPLEVSAPQLNPKQDAGAQNVYILQPNSDIVSREEMVILWRGESSWVWVWFHWKTHTFLNCFYTYRIRAKYSQRVGRSFHSSLKLRYVSLLW